MSQPLQKLLNNKPLHSRISSLFHHQPPPSQFTAPLVGALSSSTYTPTLYPNFNSSLISKSDNKISSFNGFQVYPSFSFGYFLNPVSLSGLPYSEIAEAQEVVVDGDESRKIWADSVKKKRKRKMNKHKLKKLRKRLRHCS